MSTRPRQFSLTPALPRDSEQVQPPVSFVPAIPVRLLKLSHPIYALVDTSAVVSTVSARFWKQIVAPNLLENRVANMFQASLTVFDESFREWFTLLSVPFVVQRSEASDSVTQAETEDIVLGVQACLSELSIKIDYPRRILTVWPPRKSDNRRIGAGVGVASRQIREAEALMRMRSYDSAVALMAAGLEELLSSSGSKLGGSGRPVNLQSFEGWENLSPEVASLLQEFMILRRRAVHGTEGESLSQADAQIAFKKARQIVRALSRAGT